LAHFCLEIPPVLPENQIEDPVEIIVAVERELDLSLRGSAQMKSNIRLEVAPEVVLDTLGRRID
jgi:hypothetical protein